MKRQIITVVGKLPVKVQVIPLLTVKDVVSGGYLNLSENALYMLLQSGKLKGTRVGNGEKLWRTTPEWIQEYIEREHAPNISLLPIPVLPVSDQDELELMEAIVVALATLGELQERWRLLLEARVAKVA